ncbi:MAG: Ger(x)C family spore germination protein [Tepidanaerobacteraceae bacterium]|jgi:spore germination protein KC
MRLSTSSSFIIIASLIGLLAVMITGCWDMRDVDRSLFVGSIGVDANDVPGEYNITFSFPVARMVAGGQEAGGGGGKEVKPVMVQSTIASSITEAATNMALRLNRDIFFDHMRIVVIGEEAARQGLDQIIDPFFRQAEFNRRARIAIAEGEAKKVLEIQPWVEVLKADYLETILINQTLSSKFFSIELGDFMHNIHAMKGNSLVSKITPNTEEVWVGGAAAIKKLQLVGWLSEEETQGVNIFLGNLRGGDIRVNSEELGNVTFSVMRANRKLKLISTEPVPKFHLKVEVSGNIASTAEHTRLSSKEIEVIENLVSQKVKSVVMKGATKLKDDLKVDLLMLCDYMHKFHPKQWKKCRDRWEEVFPNILLTVDVDTTVRDIGITK